MSLLKQHSEFSKLLLIQESILVWIMTIAFIILAFYCVIAGYLGSLPWLSTMVAFPWGAYGVSQAFYYNKSKAENTQGGIKFESMIQQIPQNTLHEYSFVDITDNYNAEFPI